MATITTTIKEPKTFQQIQDEQTQLGKEKALEDLNNNIAKLIQTINKKSEKELTADEKKIKANQLELSRLQLQRAQLGLANDQKHYSEYSQKYSRTHGVGSSIGVDQNTRDNTTAIALSAVTGGMLNPVVVKQVLLPPLKVMTNAVGGIVKALAPSRRISGKSSSAVDSDKDRKLHGKLDQIIGAIKEKTKPSSKKEGKEKSLLSRVVDSLLGLLKGVGKIALGMVAATILAKLGEKIGPTLEKLIGKVVGREAAPDVVKLLQDIGPEMIAGYMLGGWKGALLGGGLKLAWDAWNELFPKETDVKAPPKISHTVADLNTYLPKALQFNDDPHFKATFAGLMLGGLKGMVVGWAAGKYGEKFKDWIGGEPPADSTGIDDKTWKDKLGEYLTSVGLGDSSTLLYMMAGFYGAGLKGLVFGYAAGQIKQQIDLVNKQKEALKDNDPVTAKEVREGLKDAQFRTAIAGALFGLQAGGGIQGAIIGGLLGFATSHIAQAYARSGTLSGAFGEMLDQPILGVPSSVWVGTLSLVALAIKSKLGWTGVLAGAVLGAIGGFVADRYRSKQLIEQLGYEAEWKGTGYKIKTANGTYLDIAEIRQQARENLMKKGEPFTDADVQNEAARILREDYNIQTKEQKLQLEQKAELNNNIASALTAQSISEMGIENISEKDRTDWQKGQLKLRDKKIEELVSNIREKFIEKGLMYSRWYDLYDKQYYPNNSKAYDKLLEEEAAKYGLNAFVLSQALQNQKYDKSLLAVNTKAVIIDRQKEAQIQQDKKEQKEQQIENNRISERTAVATEKLVEIMEEEKKEKKEVQDTSSSDSSNVGQTYDSWSLDGQLNSLFKE